MKQQQEHTAEIDAWIVTHQFGASSQPWLWRQVVGFQRVRPHVVCWNRENELAYPINGTPLTLVPFSPTPYEGPGRFRHRLLNVPSRNFYGAVGAEKRWLVDRCRHERPRVMLCHFGYSALRLLPVAQSMDIPLVVHFHGLDVSSGLRNRWYRWSIQRALHRFAAIVVVGSHQRKWVLEHGVPERTVHLIPCGVPTSEFVPAPEQQHEGVRFICVSRLEAFKGVDYSLRAFAQVQQEVPGARLKIIGDGPDRAKLQALAGELNVAAHVEFLGSIPVAEVRRHMQLSDVFLQHSLVGSNGWVEGFGVSITEASALAKPVVVTNCGGITDQVIDGVNGFVVQQRDALAMADAMLQLAGDPQLRVRLGQAGRERAVKWFDAKHLIASLEAVLIEAAKVTT